MSCNKKKIKFIKMMKLNGGLLTLKIIPNQKEP